MRSEVERRGRRPSADTPPGVFERTRAAPTNELTYFGHSLGGLFGTHVLLTRPSSFDRYILSSPSLWWDDEHVFGIVMATASTPPVAATRVVFGIGALETDAGRRLEDEFHATVPGIVLSRALRWFYRD